MTRSTCFHAMASALVAAGLAACGGDGGSGSNGVDVPSTFTFDSQLEDGASSVSYDGQVARQVLIDALNEEIGNNLQDRIDNNTWVDGTTTRDDILAELEKFFDGGTDQLGSTPIDVPAFPGTTEEETFADLAGDKDLAGKLAGNDDVTDHADWDGGDFVGGSLVDGSPAGSPEALVRDWFDTIADNVLMDLSGAGRSVNFSGSGVQVLTVYQTDDGLDLKQLVEKFVRGAVTLSQGMDDYLDDDVDGKGLRTDNTGPDDGAPFTALEHQFDEGFGYFGAARDYNDYTDDEIAGAGGRPDWENGYHDSDGSGTIDLDAEFNFGHSTNAGKRDRGSTTGTDFSQATFDAFLEGRAIINEAVGRDLTDDEMADLQAQRDIIVENWEKAVSATVVHYINDTLGDMADFGMADYSYADHTKHFGEMKGFALGLQFNPRSPLHEDNDGDGTVDFEQLHGLIGQKPVLPDDTDQAIEDYEADLLAARALLQTAYGFARDDVENW